MGLACVAPAAVVAQAADVGAVAASAADEEVLRHLEALVDARLVRRQVERPDDLAQLLAAGRQWPERRVVVVDRGRAVLHVLDTRDGTVVTRLLSDASVRASPYAVAFVAAELLGLSAQLGASTPGAEGAPPSAPAPASDAGPVDGRDGAPGFGLGLGGELSLHPGSGVRMLRPTLDAVLQLDAGAAPAWLLLGLRAAAFGSWATGNGDDRVELTRHRLGLRLGLGHSFGRTSLATALAFGLEPGRTRVAAGEPDETLLGWLGLGLSAHHPLIGELGVFAGIDATWTPVGTRYRVRGDEVVGPGRLGLALSLGLAWHRLR